jgi:TetR/AcrR family transcriptional regulator
VKKSRINEADVAERVIAAATELFAKRGFSGTSLQAVADAVGVTKQAVLYYFANKQVLRSAVLDRVLSRWKDILPRLLATAASGGEMFDAVLDECIEYFTADRNRARLLVRELLDRPPDMRTLTGEQLTPWTSITADYIRRGQAVGRVRADVDPEAYLVQITTLVIGSIATCDHDAPLSPILGEDGDDHAAAVRRNIAELVRIARVALFTDPR